MPKNGVLPFSPYALPGILLSASLLLSGGCAPHGVRVTLAGALPAAKTFFGGEVRHGGNVFPVQGGAELGPQGGVMAFMLPHGQVLGECRSTVEAGRGGVAQTGAVYRVQCRPRPGTEAAARLLEPAARAVLRLAPVLPGGRLNAEGVTAECRGGECVYEDRAEGVGMTMRFSGSER